MNSVIALHAMCGAFLCKKKNEDLSYARFEYMANLRFFILSYSNHLCLTFYR